MSGLGWGAWTPQSPKSHTLAPIYLYLPTPPYTHHTNTGASSTLQLLYEEEELAARVAREGRKRKREGDDDDGGGGGGDEEVGFGCGVGVCFLCAFVVMAEGRTDRLVLLMFFSPLSFHTGGGRGVRRGGGGVRGGGWGGGGGGGGGKSRGAGLFR